MNPKLINALIQVESGGDDNAIGDKGLANKAYGPLQIRAPYLEDALPYMKPQAALPTVESLLGDRTLSIAVFEAYMARYATAHRLGHIPTDEDIARIHNGGPNGWKNPATLGYWTKVQAHLT